VDQSGGLLANPPLIGNREDILQEQDPTLAVVAYNESFCMSFSCELLSIGGRVVGTDGGSSRFSCSTIQVHTKCSPINQLPKDQDRHDHVGSSEHTTGELC
jgi:hypothetical protein